MANANGDTERGKSCFVIGPIGDAASAVRSRSDKVFDHVIRPAAEECGYLEIIRSDMDPRPGLINSQVITHLLDDDLVIADLTGQNANVFYELAIRHMVKKPIVQIIKSDERIPFDINQNRTIPLDHTDLDSAASCRKELMRQIRAVESDPTLVDNPISQTVRLRALDQSSDPDDKRDATILRVLEDLSLKVNLLSRPSLKERIRSSPFRRGDLGYFTDIDEVIYYLSQQSAYTDLPSFRRQEFLDIVKFKIENEGVVSGEETGTLLVSYLERAQRQSRNSHLDSEVPF